MKPLIPHYDDVSTSDRKEPANGMDLMYVKRWGWWEKLFSLEPIDYYEILQPMDSDQVFGRSLQDLREWFKDLEEYNPEFEEIFFEEHSVRIGCSEYRSYYYVVGKRRETAEETSRRIEGLRIKAEAREKAELEKVEAKKEKERKEFERLRKKFEGGEGGT